MAESVYNTLTNNDLSMMLGATSGTTAYTIPRSDAKKIVFGQEASSNTPSGIVIGNYAHIDHAYNVGWESTQGIAIGQNAAITGTEGSAGIALGNSARTSGGIAIGLDAVGGRYGITIGPFASSIQNNYNTRPIAIGYSACAEATGTNMLEGEPIAIGTYAHAKDWSIAIGYDAVITGDENLAGKGGVGIGKSTCTTGTGGSVAIGDRACAGNGGTSLGAATTANNTGIAIGFGATANTTRGLAIGYYSRVEGSDRMGDNYEVCISAGAFSIKMSAFDFINTFAQMSSMSTTGSWSETDQCYHYE